MIDEGYFTRKKSFDKLIAYELRPWLTKQFGMVRIKELRLGRPSNGSLCAAVQICTAWEVSEVWLPYFKTKLTKTGWKAFFDLQRLANERGIRLKRYGDPQANEPDQQTAYPETYRHAHQDKAAVATNAYEPVHEPTQRY